DDGDACTSGETCQNGTCGSPTSTVTCTALDQCHVAGMCDPTSGVCSNPAAADGTVCDDGNACTYTDTCSGGQCVGTAITCTSDQCNTRTCNGTASCTVTPLTGTSCDDGNACSFNDTCTSGGQCVGTAITCTADQCNTRTCNGTASGTVTAAAGARWDDGDACSFNDTCTSGGQCVGTAITCTSDQCNTLTCNGT